MKEHWALTKPSERREKKVRIGANFNDAIGYMYKKCGKKICWITKDDKKNRDEENDTASLHNTFCKFGLNKLQDQYPSVRAYKESNHHRNCAEGYTNIGGSRHSVILIQHITADLVTFDWEHVYKHVSNSYHLDYNTIITVCPSNVFQLVPVCHLRIRIHLVYLSLSRSM